MFEEAQAELEEIDPFCRHLPEVLAARIPLYRALEKWDLMAIVAKKLTEWSPEEPGNFVDWAYATRRAESIHLAHAILMRAEEPRTEQGKNGGRRTIRCPRRLKAVKPRSEVEGLRSSS